MSETSNKILPDFYTVKYQDEESKKTVKRINVLYLNLIEYLKKLGFYRFDKDNQYYILKVENNIVEEVDQTKIVDSVESHLSTFGDDLPSKKYPIKKRILLNHIFSKITTYFAPSILNRLQPDKPIQFEEDTKERSLFFYKNGIAEVTKNGIQLLDYSTLGDKKIWKNQVLKRDFVKLDFEDFKDTPFARFVYNISSKHKDGNNLREEPERFKTLQCIIGSKGIGWMLNVDKLAKTFTEIDGKNFDQTKSNRYNQCGLDTKLIHVNDAKPDIDLELFFTDITEGVAVKKLYVDPFTIRSKIIISTNRTINTSGGSKQDRCIEFEMSNHYSKDFSPLDEFGHWFFSDWDDSTWNQFDNFMLYCVYQYMRNGLIKPSEINLNRRKLIEETKRDFVEYMDKVQKIKSGQEYNRLEVLNDFKKYYPEFENLKTTTFTKYLNAYGKYSDKWYFNSKDENCLKRTNGLTKVIFHKK